MPPPTPLVDLTNPCYAPAISPTEFLDRLRTHQRAADRSADAYIPTFSQLLEDFDPSLLSTKRGVDKASESAGKKKRRKREGDENDDDGQLVFQKPWEAREAQRWDALGRYDARKAHERRFYRAPSGTTHPHASAQKKEPRMSATSTRTASTASLSSPSLSLSSTSSENESSMDGMVFNGPPKSVRSSMAPNESSFDIDENAAPIGDFFDGHAGPSSDAPWYYRKPLSVVGIPECEAQLHALREEYYGPPLGTETPRGLKALASRLDVVLPGMRLSTRLGAVDHQGMVDFLAAEGLVNARVLAIFRASEIWRLDLSLSLADEMGLNSCGTETLRVLTRPNSFLCLTELDLSDTPLVDYDVTLVHHLSLRTLLLNNTGIGDEAIFHLVRLRHSLSHLHIEANPRVSDACAPALLLLSRLKFLALLDTGMQIPGLRVLARGMKETGRSCDVAIPRQCEEWIRRMHTRYEPDPKPPLITDPAAAGTLSKAALRRNLAAHAARNAEISTGGTESEMRERLRGILEERREDMLVRGMMWGDSEGSDGDEDKEGDVSDDEDEDER